jgi:hypothetical protein
MLTRLNIQRDESLVYHLRQVDDWFVFGSVAFRQKTDLQRTKLLFYKLIRSVERHNKGQFVVRFEGDNKRRERHFHFLLGKRGIYTDNFEEIQKRLKERAMDLAHASQLLVEPNPPHRKKLVFDYPEYQTCSTDFRPYNPKQSAIQYISKRAFDERENNDGYGLDSCVQGLDWKMSPTLKKRLKNINSEHIGHY